MKKAISILLLLCCIVFKSYSQQDTVHTNDHADTTIKIVVAKPVRRSRPADTLKQRPVAGTMLTIDTPAAPGTVQRDSAIVVATGSARPGTDTPKKAVAAGPVFYPLDSVYLHLLDNPFFRSKARPVYLIINERMRASKDEMFYLLLTLLFFLSLTRLSFSQYFNNIFRQIVQPSFRQKQTREQLSQNNFPSLLLNLFFIFSGGAFIALLMQYYNLSRHAFEINFFYATVALLLLYLVKFVLLSFAGWVFNVKEATETYIFIVFLVNKITGIILLPFSFIIAFSEPCIITISVTIALMLVCLFFLYRYIASAGLVKKEMNIHFLHFIFYILAFEITPLLLIYKTLGIYLAKGA